jgi:hypothetical protein
MISQEIKDKIIKLRIEGYSYKDIGIFLDITPRIAYTYSKNIQLTDEKRHKIRIKNINGWSDEEIKFLKKYYSINGPKYCTKKLNRTNSAIHYKANELKLKFSIVQEIKWTQRDLEFLKINYPIKGLKFCSEELNRSISSVRSAISTNRIILKIDRSNSKNRHIIKKLENNKVLAYCKIHGNVIHYNWKSNHSLVCQLCSQNKIKIFNKTDRGRELKRERNKLERKNSIVNFKDRIRNRLNNTYHGRAIHFKDLGYSGEELRNHIHKIKEQQNNRCPICLRDYNECKMIIDHIIPLATAKSKQEIIQLFALSNLSPLCSNCNSSKWKNNFDEWKNKKLLEREGICV